MPEHALLRRASDGLILSAACIRLQRSLCKLNQARNCPDEHINFEHVGHCTRSSRAPVFGSTRASISGLPAGAINGVLEVVEIPRGITVLVNNLWVALQEDGTGKNAGNQRNSRVSEALIAESQRLVYQSDVKVRADRSTELVLATS